MFLDRTAPKEPPRSGKPQAKLWCPRGRSCSRVDTGCLRCLLLVICTYPFAKEALTLHLARSEGHERYFGCNLMHCRVLASSHQHLIAEAPRCFDSPYFGAHAIRRGRHGLHAALRPRLDSRDDAPLRDHRDSISFLRARPDAISGWASVGRRSGYICSRLRDRLRVQPKRALGLTKL